MTIIQNSTTGQYLDAEGKWVAEPAKALAFETSVAALGYLFEKQLRNVILVMRFRDPQYDIRLHPLEEPVPPEALGDSNRAGEAPRRSRRKGKHTAPPIAPSNQAFGIEEH